MAKTKLSETQKEVVEVIKEHGGVLVRWVGGYWTWEGAKVKEEAPMVGRVPEWHCGTSTIRALIDRGLLSVIDTNRYGDPIKVRLNDEIERKKEKFGGRHIIVD